MGLHSGLSPIAVPHCCPRAAYGSWHFFLLLSVGSARQRSGLAQLSSVVHELPRETLGIPILVSAQIPATHESPVGQIVSVASEQSSPRSSTYLHFLSSAVQVRLLSHCPILASAQESPAVSIFLQMPATHPLLTHGPSLISGPYAQSPFTKHLPPSLTLQVPASLFKHPSLKQEPHVTLLLVTQTNALPVSQLLSMAPRNGGSILADPQTSFNWAGALQTCRKSTALTPPPTN